LTTLKGWNLDTLDKLGVGRDRDGRWLFETAAGQLRYADDGRKPKMLAANGSSRELWPAPEDVAGDVLVVVEGEPDAVSATQLGYAAVALPGAGKWNDGWPARLAAGRTAVALVTDADSVGRKRMKRAAEGITRAGVQVSIVDLAPERSDGYDLGDVLAEFGDARARELIDGLMWQARPFEPEPEPIKPAASTDRVAVFVRASDVQIRPVVFLYRPWLPLGKVTILAGAPGQGKSQLTAYLAAHTTRGSFYDSDVHEPGSVVIMTAEDDVADTVVPRLIAAGADCSRVEFVNMRRTLPGGITTDGLIKLPGDVDTLQRRLEVGDVRLVVLDPVASFVGRENSTYVNQDVRDVLDPIVTLAARYGAAVVLVLHLNKSEAKTWALKIGESHAFQAVARTVLALAPDPDDEDGERGTEKILAATKANVSMATVSALRLRVESVTVAAHDGTPIETSRIIPVGLSTVSADDLLADQAERGSRRHALEFLLDTLADGPMESRELQTAAKAAGVAWRTVERYYREVCKPAKPAIARGPWLYALQDRHIPTHPLGGHGGDGAEVRQDRQGGERGIGGFGHNGRQDDTPGGHGEQTTFDLAAYRRHRDAILGERDDDE
jgi:putative DNA primase/helicase